MLPADTFVDDVVVIAGAEQLLSRAAAIEFARAGARVALLYSPAAAVVDIPELTALTPHAIALSVDLLDEQAVVAVFDRIEATLGGVSVLLCNPRLPATTAAEQLTLKQWRAVVQSMADAAFVCCTEFARRCIRSQRGGAILNVVETMAWQGGPGLVHASAAEAALVNMSKTLAVEWGPDNIRVNAIAVGPFRGDDTPASRQAARDGRDLAKSLPALRLGEPHEFGWTATMLCSPYAAYTSGTTFIIDGGSQIRRGIFAPSFVPVRQWAGE
jgi:NAD(P)-dependent dehydrogenase (short-subunit alcohol dehydrogenase family)